MWEHDVFGDRGYWRCEDPALLGNPWCASWPHALADRSATDAHPTGAIRFAQSRWGTYERATRRRGVCLCRSSYEPGRTVQRFLALLVTHDGDCTLTISRAAQLLDMSDRTLRLHFHQLGYAPKAMLTRTRLQRARTALQRGGMTVTEAAGRFAFASQLGRFSALYRREFGEHPSNTLLAALAHPGWPDAGIWRGRGIGGRF